MEQHIIWFNRLLTTSLALYFRQECEYSDLEEVPAPEDGWLERMTGMSDMDFREKVVVLLALMPHVCPQGLDILFVQNKNVGRPYTEFGGWKGLSHGGFLPTGETAAFILAGENSEKRQEVIRLFHQDHRLHVRNILHMEGGGEGEPFLSGQLRASDELLSRVFFGREYKPDYRMGFPAKRVSTALEWEDMVLDYQVQNELEEINTWIQGHRTIMEGWGLSRFLKAGYRTLFYGPPGTGKTLAATLIGKRNGMDVYRVDLSMVVSKYIGETEKNLAAVFDLAENRNWILFFDEADALFGKRTSANTSNDRHANQEVAYLLQRIEDFPGTVILATNLRANIDEAFSRRFQSVIYFPMPERELRVELWKNMLPANWLGSDADALIEIAAEAELSGGSISNVIRRCALNLLGRQECRLSRSVLKEALAKEELKR